MRAFKIIARDKNWQGYVRQVKKRVYTSLSDFNQYCVTSTPPNSGTLERYKSIYFESHCYELIDGKWIEIDVEVNKLIKN